MEDVKKILPEASSYTDAIRKAQEDTEDIDFSSGTLTLVDVDFTVYRRRMDQRMVRRNVTLPSWLNLEADRLGLNVSRVLQDALADKVTQLR